ncbi:hypothetical protein B0H10DRAFT_2260023 [Mycena sp. CBHHK59/15]|nr:hypothetical protein B0H10DRAFT_2260023 [Mycena sp. CBHHK59/15]
MDSNFPDDPCSRDASPGPDNCGENPAAADIKRVFHPHSRHSVVFQSFDAYMTSNVAERSVPPNPQPWRPFRSQLDFEVAEFCEENLLNRDTTGNLISLIRCCMLNPDDFTLKSQRELDELWELASYKCTAFEKGTITIKYKKEDKTFDTYVRPLWKWTLSLIRDPHLATCFVWDSEKAYRFNGESYVRFYREPWTANAFWAAQSGLPDDPAAKPVCYAVYANKSKLSSFGTQKAYAVVARVANIPVDIRNTTRFGGGQIVGHQPIVKDDPQEKDKPAFSNFKNIVWHEALYKLLKSIVDISMVGQWTPCGDGVDRQLFPRIVILAADYEEACVMALIRGLQGMYPCPICFVPWNEQSDLSMEHPLRTGSGSQHIVEEARTQRTKEEREAHLKDHGLHDIDNMFWKIHGSDPHEAISYDPLHADDGGFWGDHLFSQFKARIEALGRSAIVKIDSQMAAFPRWRNLNHFETVMNTSFNDGSKHKDIAKMMLFVAHNVLVDEPGHLLLQALRSYLEFRNGLGAEVHTAESIADRHREVEILDSVMKNYVEACVGTEYEKNWNFPKKHSHRHAFTDIENKGAAHNFGMKISESMHGAIRGTYHRLTNFKNVTPQLVKHDHRRMVGAFIREQIDALEEGFVDADLPEDLEVLSNVNIGFKLKPVAFSTLEHSMPEDPAFHRFCIRFGGFISDFLPAFGYNLPNGKRLSFNDTDTIAPFQFLKVHYDSLSTWNPVTDYLRCNPNFNGHPRYDCVLVKTEEKPFFARLLYMFSCTVEQKPHPFALILPLDAPTGRARKVDKALRFRRVQAKLRKHSEFISVHSIICGAVLVPDIDKPREFIVFDVLDTDTSRRLQDLYPRHHDEE